jgi:hypothetical protein
MKKMLLKFRIRKLMNPPYEHGKRRNPYGNVGRGYSIDLV